MKNRVLALMLLGITILAGCADSQPPPATESIPTIPPGRSSADSGGGDTSDPGTSGGRTPPKPGS